MQLKNLKSKVLGKNCIHYKSIDSTQKEAWRLIETYQEKMANCKQDSNIKNKSDDCNGTVIMADIQTDGIGTHGRTWYTDNQDNIAFSIILNLNCHIDRIENITIKIAEILVDIFKEKYNIHLNIKKPNDIVFQNKKIAGILVETKIQVEKVRWMVVGIGINSNTEHFRDEIFNIATSIKKEFHIQVDNAYIITEFCNRFEQEIENRMFKSIN